MNEKDSTKEPKPHKAIGKRVGVAAGAAVIAITGVAAGEAYEASQGDKFVYVAPVDTPEGDFYLKKTGDFIPKSDITPYRAVEITHDKEDYSDVSEKSVPVRVIEDKDDLEPGTQAYIVSIPKGEDLNIDGSFVGVPEEDSWVDKLAVPPAK